MSQHPFAAKIPGCLKFNWTNTKCLDGEFILCSGYYTAPGSVVLVQVVQFQKYGKKQIYSCKCIQTSTGPGSEQNHHLNRLFSFHTDYIEFAFMTFRRKSFRR